MSKNTETGGFTWIFCDFASGGVVVCRSEGMKENHCHFSVQKGKPKKWLVLPFQFALNWITCYQILIMNFIFFNLRCKTRPHFWQGSKDASDANDRWQSNYWFCSLFFIQNDCIWREFNFRANEIEKLTTCYVYVLSLGCNARTKHVLFVLIVWEISSLVDNNIIIPSNCDRVDLMKWIGFCICAITIQSIAIRERKKGKPQSVETLAADKATRFPCGGSRLCDSIRSPIHTRTRTHQ